MNEEGRRAGEDGRTKEKVEGGSQKRMQCGNYFFFLQRIHTLTSVFQNKTNILLVSFFVLFCFYHTHIQAHNLVLIGKFDFFFFLQRG